jgi:ribosome maturation factor RimP
MSGPQARAQALRERLGPFLDRLGFELVEVHFVPRRSRPLLRVFLDVGEGSTATAVTHGDCARVSRELHDFLEAEELLEGSCMLEVSSPGIHRPLTQPKHFLRNKGRLLEIHGEEPSGETFERVARLVDVEPEALLVETDGREERLPLGQVRRARVVPEFRRPDDPRKKGPPGRERKARR